MINDTSFPVVSSDFFDETSSESSRHADIGFPGRLHYPTHFPALLLNNKRCCGSQVQTLAIGGPRLDIIGVSARSDISD